MSERLADVVLGLQRMAENAKLRGDDLRYIQQQETWEHVRWLDELLGMVDKVRSALLDERKRFQPPAERRDQNPAGWRRHASHREAGAEGGCRVTDIVERLRHTYFPDPLTDEAANEIERLQAHAKSMVDALNADIDVKAAEIERLRAALQAIARITTYQRGEVLGADS